MFTDEQEQALYEAFLRRAEPRLIVPATEGVPCVEFRHGGGWRECRIWEGYLDASNLLLGEILQNSPRADNLIFPAIFCLRHGLEMALKWHIGYADGKVPRRAGHDLGVLVEAFRRTADHLDDETTYVSSFVMDSILELASIDPDAIAFRYSSNANGSGIEIRPECWDVQHLYFMVGELSICLDDLSNCIERSRMGKY